MTSQTLKISPASMISPAQNQIASELGGEAVILNLESGMYYGLNEVVASVWEFIQKPCTFASILEHLLAEYDVQPDICEHDLNTILSEMQHAHLIEVSDETVE